MNEFQEFVTRNLQVVRLHNGLVDLLGQQFAPDFLSQGRLIFFQDTTPARQRFNHALAFELRISFGYRVAIDAQLLSQRTDGRQRFPGLDRPRSGSGLDLFHNLQVDGQTGLEIDLK